MGTLNYSTTVPMARTVGEIQDILARAGADAVGTRYENRRPVGVSFMLNTAAGVASFTLPVNVDAVHKLLVQQHAAGQLGKQASKAVLTSREHAERVAWRVAKDWLVAQLALVEAGMATLDQVMLPYLTTGEGRTLYDDYRVKALRAVDRG